MLAPDAFQRAMADGQVEFADQPARAKGGQRFAKDAPDPEAHRLKRQFGGNGIYPENDPRIGHEMLHFTKHRKGDFGCQVHQDQVRRTMVDLFHEARQGAGCWQQFEALYLPKH